MKQILDAHGLMVFLEKEPGYKKIESLFTSAMEKDGCQTGAGRILFLRDLPVEGLPIV
jgi:hypothetical protein